MLQKEAFESPRKLKDQEQVQGLIRDILFSNGGQTSKATGNASKPQEGSPRKRIAELALPKKQPEAPPVEARPKSAGSPLQSQRRKPGTARLSADSACMAMARSISYKDKRKAQMNADVQRLQHEEDKECTFRPSISRASERICRRNQGKMKRWFHDIPVSKSLVLPPNHDHDSSALERTAVSVDSLMHANFLDGGSSHFSSASSDFRWLRKDAGRATIAFPRSESPSRRATTVFAGGSAYSESPGTSYRSISPGRRATFAFADGCARSESPGISLRSNGTARSASPRPDPRVRLAAAETDAPPRRCQTLSPPPPAPVVRSSSPFKRSHSPFCTEFSQASSNGAWTVSLSQELPDLSERVVHQPRLRSQRQQGPESQQAFMKAGLSSWSQQDMRRVLRAMVVDAPSTEKS